MRYEACRISRGTRACSSSGFSIISTTTARRSGPMLEHRLQADRADGSEGFYGYHLAEHHSTPLGLVPSPSVLIAAAIQRTKRIRIGPLVYVLPMYHPLRLFEEICMLDHMSNGRLMLGRRARRHVVRASSATASIPRNRRRCITRPMR